MILLNSTLTGTMVWVVHCLRLMVVLVAAISMQFWIVEPSTMGWPLRSMPSAGMPAFTRIVVRKLGGAGPEVEQQRARGRGVRWPSIRRRHR